jgi:PAS domain S-box-containing protein
MIGPLDELLSNPADQIVTKRESIELVHRNSLRLLRLVNTLLDFSRIEADRVQALYEPVDLAALTADLASTFRSVVEKAGMSLTVNCPPLAESIYVDRGMWEKIVLNLLSNAFKFTLAGGIDVTIVECGEEVELSVSDTGAGIPAHELSNIFKRFHRVQGAPGRTYEGTGIGLSLVENLVKLHGGSVRVESNLGQGTTFFIRIPKGFQHLSSEHLSAVPRSESGSTPTHAMFVEEAGRWLPDTFTNLNASVSQQSNGAHPRRRVLLADDNADMRQYVQRILAPEFDIEAVPNGMTALSAVKERTPDLVLTDVMMPELDGFGLLRELRNDRRTQGIPVVMLSARAGEEARVEGLQAGADDYLVKPFNARELLARVRVNLELSNLRKELFREEEKTRSAEGMQRQWRLFDTALSHSPDSIYVFDLNKRFTYANRALLNRWRKPLNELLGKTMLEVGYPPELAETINQQIDLVIQNSAPFHNIAPLARLARPERIYDYILVPVFSQDGSVEAVAGSSRDITEFIEKNSQLQEAIADLEQFAFSASHDLQAPLRVIDNVSKWLEEDLEDHLTPETREHILLLRRRVKRMERLLDDLLQYARIGRKEEKGHKELVAGDVLVADTVALLPRDGFTITVSPAFAQIRLRRMPLQQVLLNLIGNAVKHHHRKDGHIHVTVQETAGRYEFAVKDDGPGIAPQFHSQIFKMFQTLKPKDQVEGSGMGLALVRKWVDLNGGQIRLESAEGKGSTFFFTWPKITELE